MTKTLKKTKKKPQIKKTKSKEKIKIKKSKTKTKPKKKPKKKRLSTKQKEFCELVGNGSSLYKAYLQAYPTSQKWNRKTVYNRANDLMQNGEIVGSIKAIEAKITEKTLNEFAKSKIDILKEYESLIKQVIKARANPAISEKGKTFHDISLSGALREIRECLKEQGKLLGYYEETVNLKTGFLDFLNNSNKKQAEK